MGRITIEGIHIVTYDEEPGKRYWKGMSDAIATKFGKTTTRNHAQVEAILLECFAFLANEFKGLVSKEKSLTFYLYLSWLHEESIKLYQKILGGLQQNAVSPEDLAMYRRVLKLICEQGCDVDLAWGKQADPNEANRINGVVADLHYLGTWLYYFADTIAIQKMVHECHEISFGHDGILEVGFQHHYGTVYSNFFPLLIQDYREGTFDENSVLELRDAIESCFGINYAFAGSQIFKIKEHHGPGDPVQTIEPYVLPANLVAVLGVDPNLARAFYDGLTITRKNKLTLEDAILKPYSMQRYFFRPILVYTVGGVDRALVGKEKFTESIVVLATNAIHWGALPQEWLSLECMQGFVSRKAREHDKILEDKIEGILKQNQLLYCRNIKSFKQLGANNVRIDNPIAGEIDFIIVNPAIQTVFVCDTKYNRARYEMVGFRNDYSNFLKEYESQLERKLTWLTQNLQLLQGHLRIVHKKPDLDLNGFSVKPAFLINTPTFYMFNGKYPAVTLNRLTDFLQGRDDFEALDIEKNGSITRFKRPFFTK